MYNVCRVNREGVDSLSTSCMCCSTHLCLDHVVAVFSHPAHEATDVDDVVGLELVQAVVNGDDGAAASHAGTAVHHDGAGLRGVGGVDGTQEVEQRSCEFGGPVVGPLGVVELKHCVRVVSGHLHRDHTEHSEHSL